jgi:hypothetical protein
MPKPFDHKAEHSIQGVVGCKLIVCDREDVLALRMPQLLGHLPSALQKGQLVI